MVRGCKQHTACPAVVLLGPPAPGLQVVALERPVVFLPNRLWDLSAKLIAFLVTRIDQMCITTGARVAAFVLVWI
jgi:hypothetical protein